MDINYSLELIPYLKNKYLLIDTTVFIDIASKPSVYAKFFNHLKRERITLATIDFVKIEFLKGSADNNKYEEKEKLIEGIIDTVLPTNTRTLEHVYLLVKQYGIEGKAPSLTDLLLGAILMQYEPNVCLMTRDTTDFIQTIFEIPFIVNIPYNKGIHTYGIYNYKTITDPF